MHLSSIPGITQVPKACLAKGFGFLPHIFCCIEGSPTTCAPQNLATGAFTALKTFSKQIWTCSEPSSSAHKPCQACWPTCTTVLMTQPQLLDPSWPVSNQLKRGRSPAQMALSQATETQPGQALPVSPCPHPRFPWGLSLLRKKLPLIMFNQSFTTLMSSSRLHSLSPDVNTPLCQIQENQHLWIPSLSRKAHSCYCRKRLHGVGGNKGDSGSSPCRGRDDSSCRYKPHFFSFSTAPSSAFPKSWKCIVCDCLSPDQLRVSLKGRIQTIEHSTSMA